MVVDFDVLSRIVKAGVIEELDHRSLNDIVDNPTSENIIIWIWKRLGPQLSQLSELVLWETATACAILRKGDAATR
jgi:6-pyruvoyltetrahydropterin/6-carboxytetrahydropterin synthase